MKALIVLCGLFFAPMFAMANAALNIEVQADASDVSVLAADKVYYYNFGTHWVNTRSYADFTLTASGTEAVDIRRIVTYGGAFRADTNCPRVLAPRQTCTTRVFFWPNVEGSYFGDLVFQLRDHNIIVRLNGYARRP